jgi:hypothetical protein
VITAGTFALIAGLVLMWLAGSSSWGYWFGLGVAGYGLAMAGHGSNYVVYVFRRAAASASLVD